MGLINGTVELKNDYLKWKEMFTAEKEVLKQLFGNIALSIEHIGSTAVEGLSAKPIVDIAVGVNNFDDLKNIMDNLKTIYTIKQNEENGEVLLIKEDLEQTYYLIHVMKTDSKRYKNTIAFRDCLINNSDIKEEYEKLKMELSKQYSCDRKTYTKSKNDFIENVLSNYKTNK